MTNNLNFFKETFEKSRSAFLELAKASGGELQSHKISDLSFESLYLPSEGQKGRLLILTSGVHGIEGFTGSALQRYFMENNFLNLKDEKTGILIIHGINPYGFKHEIRVTENNVDLNRNFDTNDELFRNKNEGYAQLNSFLNPTRPYSKISFYSSAIFYILKYGMKNLKQAILKGQYQFSDGIFFGGKNFEPQVSLMKEIALKEYSKVLLIDLHTGFGQRGKLHLFGDRSPYLDAKYMNEVFHGLPVEYGEEGDFYAVTGGFTVYLAKLFHQKSKFAGVVFEYGTINSHKPLGSLDSLYRIINKDKTEFKEMFYPRSTEWRMAVIDQFDEKMKTIVQNWKKV